MRAGHLADLEPYRRSMRLATDDALNSHVFHQPCHSATRDIEVLPDELPPDLADAIDPPVLLEHTSDLGPQGEGQLNLSAAIEPEQEIKTHPQLRVAQVRLLENYSLSLSRPSRARKPATGSLPCRCGRRHTSRGRCRSGHSDPEPA